MRNVEKIINEWDPIELFPLAPIDEYEREIELINKILITNPQISAEKLAMEIYMIFEKRFGNDIFLKGLTECEGIAANILKNI